MSTLHAAHLLHASHILTLGNHDGERILAQCLHLHVVLRLVRLGHLAAEDTCEVVAAFSLQDIALHVLLLDDAVDDVAIYTREGSLFQLAFQHLYEGRIQLAVHHEHAVALGLRCLDVGVLGLAVCGIEINELSVLVRLVVLDESLVLFQREVLVVRVLEEEILRSLVVDCLLYTSDAADEG